MNKYEDNIISLEVSKDKDGKCYIEGETKLDTIVDESKVKGGCGDIGKLYVVVPRHNGYSMVLKQIMKYSEI
jgi:hypothetical protein